MPFWSCACALSSFLHVLHFIFHVSGRAVMFCTNCGKSCVSNAKYCHTCGKHLSESIAKEESTQNEKGQSSGGRRCRSNRSDFNEDVIKNKEKQFYCLLYSDKTKAEFLPGSDERFNLQRYKEAPVYTTNVLGTTRLNFGTRTTTF